ncbi:MAG: hypothetical protein JSV67_05620 [Thermoplasmatales archaeon]|nr:MAG: hypothetical protein JSV67_05620 [Thermoplasmatales archaeon]
MDVLEEAKELMKKAGCEKAFAVYGLELYDIAGVRNCNNTKESIELEKDISHLVPIIKRELVLDLEAPIECPLDSSMSKYLEFSLKSRNITPYNISHDECERIENEMKPLLKKYQWSIKKR